MSVWLCEPVLTQVVALFGYGGVGPVHDMPLLTQCAQHNSSCN